MLACARMRLVPKTPVPEDLSLRTLLPQPTLTKVPQAVKTGVIWLISDHFGLIYAYWSDIDDFGLVSDHFLPNILRFFNILEILPKGWALLRK